MTQLQKIMLAIAVLGFVGGAGAQLQDILSPLGAMAPVITKEIVSLAGFIGGILGVVLMATTGQASQLKAVEAMPGVQAISIDPKTTNQTLHALVADPAMEKIDYAAPAPPAAPVPAQKN